MKTKIESFEEWVGVYRQGHIAYLARFSGIFLRDFVFLTMIVMVLIKLGVIKAFSLSIVLKSAAIFFVLGVGLGELSWFLLKQRFGIPPERL